MISADTKPVIGRDLIRSIGYASTLLITWRGCENGRLGAL